MGPQWADEDQNGHPDAQIGPMGIESSRIMEMGQRLSQGPRPSILWGWIHPPPAKLTPPRDLQRSAVAPAAARSCSNLAGLGAIKCLGGPNCACRASQRAERKDPAAQGRQEEPWMGSWARGLMGSDGR